LPEHIVAAAGTTFTVGVVPTVTVTISVPLHPLLVPVTVYVVVTFGKAVTTTVLLALNVAGGAQV
jgi:hypothetical protein